MNHSLIWERDRGKREKSEESNNCNIPHPESLRNTQFTLQAVCVCVCVNIWSCVYSSLPLTFSISAKLSIQLRPITYNHLIEAVWMLLHLSSSDSWVSANEMILILRAVHVLCALVNCVIICTVYTSLHAYSRWCVEGVDEGERYVWMLQFTLAV